MGQKEKLIAKLKANPKSFTFNEAETLLGYFSYYRSNKGKTSGSRIMFVSDIYKTKILLHKRAAIYAISQQQSLNSFIEEAVRDKLAAVNA